MIAPKQGDIFLAPFAFSDLTHMMKRPVCILSVDELNIGPDVVVAMLTSRRSRIENPSIGDVVLADWKAAGLPLQSVLRAARLQTLERSLLLNRLGSLADDDLNSTRESLREVLGL